MTPLLLRLAYRPAPCRGGTKPGPGRSRAAARRRGLRRGATAVEFALVTPLAFLLVFSAIEFARVMMIRHSIDNAVYESARLAIVPGGTAAEARDETQRLLRAVGVQTAIIEISPAVITQDTPRVTLRVSVPLDANSYIPHQFFAGKTLRRELTLRREGH